MFRGAAGGLCYTELGDQGYHSLQGVMEICALVR